MMDYKVKISALFALGAFLIGALPFMVPEARAGRASVVAEEIRTFAKHLSVRPETAIDFSKTSGEYCFQVNLGAGGHMTHYAVDPTKTREDVIDFVNAASLIEAGLDVEKLPRFPGELGGMTPNQWYFLPAGGFEPHHGRKFPFPLLIKAVDLD
jgi:hypothetical protein